MSCFRGSIFKTVVDEDIRYTIPDQISFHDYLDRLFLFAESYNNSYLQIVRETSMQRKMRIFEQRPFNVERIKENVTNIKQ